MKRYIIENDIGKRVTFDWEDDKTPPIDSDFEEVFKQAQTFKPEPVPATKPEVPWTQQTGTYQPKPEDIKVDFPKPIESTPYGKDIAQQQQAETQNKNLYGEALPHGPQITNLTDPVIGAAKGSFKKAVGATIEETGRKLQGTDQFREDWVTRGQQIEQGGIEPKDASERFYVTYAKKKQISEQTKEKVNPLAEKLKTIGDEIYNDIPEKDRMAVRDAQTWLTSKEAIDPKNLKKTTAAVAIVSADQSANTAFSLLGMIPGGAVVGAAPMIAQEKKGFVDAAKANGINDATTLDRFGDAYAIPSGVIEFGMSSLITAPIRAIPKIGKGKAKIPVLSKIVGNVVKNNVLKSAISNVVGTIGVSAMEGTEELTQAELQDAVMYWALTDAAKNSPDNAEFYTEKRDAISLKPFTKEKFDNFILGFAASLPQTIASRILGGAGRITQIPGQKPIEMAEATITPKEEPYAEGNGIGVKETGPKEGPIGGTSGPVRLRDDAQAGKATEAGKVSGAEVVKEAANLSDEEAAKLLVQAKIPKADISKLSADELAGMSDRAKFDRKQAEKTRPQGPSPYELQQPSEADKATGEAVAKKYGLTFKEAVPGDRDKGAQLTFSDPVTNQDISVPAENADIEAAKISDKNRQDNPVEYGRNIAESAGVEFLGRKERIAGVRGAGKYDTEMRAEYKTSKGNTFTVPFSSSVDEIRVRAEEMDKQGAPNVREKVQGREEEIAPVTEQVQRPTQDSDRMLRMYVKTGKAETTLGRATQDKLVQVFDQVAPEDVAQAAGITPAEARTAIGDIRALQKSDLSEKVRQALAPSLFYGETVDEAVKSFKQPRAKGGEVMFSREEYVGKLPVLKGKNGNELVDYEWRWKWGTKFSNREGGDVDAKISDWEDKDVSTGTGRNIVHVYYIKNGKTGIVEPHGIESAKKMLGRDGIKIKKIADEIAAKKAYEKKQWKLETEGVLKRADKGVDINTANSEFYKAGYKTPKNTSLYEKNGKYIRIQSFGWHPKIVEENGFNFVSAIDNDESVTKENPFKKTETKAEPAQRDIFGGEKPVSQIERETAQREERAAVVQKQEARKGGEASLAGLPMFENQDIEGSQQTLQLQREERPMDVESAKNSATDNGLEYVSPTQSDNGPSYTFRDKRTGTEFNARTAGEVRKATNDLADRIAPKGAKEAGERVRFQREDRTPEQEAQITRLKADRETKYRMEALPEDIALWEANNKLIDFFRNNGYTIQETPQGAQYVKDSPKNADRYWSTFDRDTATGFNEDEGAEAFGKSRQVERGEVKLQREDEVIYDVGTAEDKAHGQAIADQLGNVKFNGVWKGFKSKDGTLYSAPQLTFTVYDNQGKGGTTILAPLDTTAGHVAKRRMDALKGEVKYQIEEPRKTADTFFSPTLRAVQGLKQERGTGEQMFAMITKTPGVKEAEWKWMGLDDFLKGKQSVTKKEIEEFVAQNQVRVEEVEKGKPDIPQLSAKLKRAGFEVQPAINALDSYNLWRGDKLIETAYDAGEFTNEVQEYFDLADKPIRKAETKFSQYSLPGGENYREVLLTLPDNKGEGKWGTLDDNGKLIQRYDTETEARSAAGTTGTYGRSTDAKKEGYRSSHWDEPNVIAHVRLDDRTGPNGEKVLFVEEIQSDWAREAREQGTTDDRKKVEPLIKEETKRLEEKYPYLESVERDSREGVGTRRERYTEWLSRIPNEEKAKLEEMRSKLSTIPAQPFLKNWEELVMKRVLHMAAEEGYDRLSWINGEQTAARYDLSKQLDGINWKPYRDGKSVVLKGLKGISDQDIEIATDKDGVITVTDIGAPKDWEGKKLSDVIGKDIAEKIMTSETGDLSGKGLSIGGEWAKSLYDRMIPKFLEKYGKRWQTKVENVKLGESSAFDIEDIGQDDWVVTKNGEPYASATSKEDARRQLEELGGNETKIGIQQSIPITPEMRKSVLYEGQPMFQKEGQREPTNLRREEPTAVRETPGRNLPAKDREAGNAVPENVSAVVALSRAIERSFGTELPEGSITAVDAPQEEMYQVTDRLISEEFGRTPVWFSVTEEAKNAGVRIGGARLRSHPEAIFINQETKKPVVVTAVHETMHVMQESNPDLYYPVLETMMAEATPEFEAYRQRMIEKGYSEREVMDEVVAEISGERFTDPEFLQALHERSPDAFRAFVETLRRVIQQIKDWIRKSGIEHPGKYFVDLNRVDKQIQDSLIEMRRRGQPEMKMAAQREDKFSRDRKEKNVVKIILKAIEEDQKEYKNTGFEYGIRIHEYPIKKGDKLEASHDWDFENDTPSEEYLSGTSVLGLGDNPTINDITTQLRMAGQGGKNRRWTGGHRGYGGDYIALVRGENRGYGADEGERLLDDPVVLATFKREEGYYGKIEGPAFSREKGDQTKTEAFRNWFKGSKVVDDNGEPLVVYHGTGKRFYEFMKEMGGGVTKSNSAKEGFWFSDKVVATGYGDLARTKPVQDLIDASYRAERKGQWDLANRLIQKAEKLEQKPSKKPIVMSVYLDMKNPKIYDADSRKFNELEDEFNQIIKDAKENGNDGVIFKNLDDNADWGTGRISDHYVVFSPTQIKSAIGNRGTFDPENPDIRFSREAPKGTTPLYRGDATEIGEFDITKADPRALFGQAMYLTDSKRIAGDYKNKGAGYDVGVLYKFSSRTGTKKDAYDSWIRQRALYVDENGDAIESFTGKQLPVFDDDPIRNKRIAQAEKLADKEFPNLEIRKQADNTFVIRSGKAPKTGTQINIPNEVLKKTLNAEDEISVDVADVLYQSLVNSGDQKTAKDMRDFAIQKNEDGYRPSYRNVYTSITSGSNLISDEGQAILREELQALGYTGIQYSGGVTMGGEKHNAYALWNTDFEDKVKFSREEKEPAYKVNDKRAAHVTVDQLPAIYEEARTFDSKTAAERLKKRFGIKKQSLALARYIGRTVSGTLLEISPVIRDALQKQVNRVMIDTAKANRRVLPLVKAISKMPEEDAKVFDIAAKNADSEKINELAGKYGFRDALDEYRTVMDEIVQRAKDAGYETGYLKDYFPRMPKDRDAYRNYIRGLPEWGQIEEAMRDKSKAVGHDLNEDEQAEFLNLYIRGYGHKMSGEPGQLKERTVKYLDNEMNALLEDTRLAIPLYVEGMIKKIARKEFFGNKKETDELYINDIDQSIGDYVAEQIRQKHLDPVKQDQLIGLLKSYFNYKPTNRTMAALKNIGYVALMGSGFSSMFSQMQDAAFGFYTAPGSEAGAIIRSLLGKNEISIKDLGIDDIAAEFRDPGKLAQYVDKNLRGVGLKWGDSIFKNAFLNANLRKYRAMAKSGKINKDFRHDLDNIFGAEADEVIADLKSGVDSDNVKLLMLNQISKFQPTTLLQVPQAYLDAPRGRIAYALKTYQINQFNAIIDESIRAMDGAKDVKAFGRAFGRIAGITAMLMAAGIGTDRLKDFLFRRQCTWGQYTVDNILKLMFISRYVTWQAREQGLYSAIVKLVAPPMSWMDYIGKDINKAFTKPEDFKLKDIESVRILPVIGQEFYWWTGGGHEKQIKQTIRKSEPKKFEKEINKLKTDAREAAQRGNTERAKELQQKAIEYREKNIPKVKEYYEKELAKKIPRNYNFIIESLKSKDQKKRYKAMEMVKKLTPGQRALLAKYKRELDKENQ